MDLAQKLADAQREVAALKATNERLRKALAPLVEIANRYYDNELDEDRPEWRERGIRDARPPAQSELLHGRGGGTLLTLGHCFDAREEVQRG